MGNRNPKMSYTLRIVAGAYVAYLGISIARMPFKQATGLPMPIAVAIGVLLAAAGVIFLINGFKGYKYLKDHPEEFEDPEETADEEETEEPEETEPAVHAPTGIMAKASMPEHLRVKYEDEEEDVEEDSEESRAE